MKVESEKKLERKLRNKIKDIGGWCLKLLSPHITGLPDRLCLIPMGRIFFAEIKTTKKTPSPRQKLVAKQLRRMGFRVEIIDTSEQIINILKEYETE